jgi:hypothetical protein
MHRHAVQERLQVIPMSLHRSLKGLATVVLRGITEVIRFPIQNVELVAGLNDQIDKPL